MNRRPLPVPGRFWRIGRTAEAFRLAGRTTQSDHELRAYLRIGESIWRWQDGTWQATASRCSDSGDRAG